MTLKFFIVAFVVAMGIVLLLELTDRHDYNSNLQDARNFLNISFQSTNYTIVEKVSLIISTCEMYTGRKRECSQQLINEYTKA